MTAAAVVLAVAHLAAAGILLRRLDPLHPAVLWTVPFAVTTSLFALHLLPYREFTWGTAMLVCGATGAVVAGTCVRLPRRRPLRPVVLEPRVVVLAAGLSLVLLAVWLAAFLAQLAAQYGARAALVTSPTVRQDLADGAAALTIKYVYVTLTAAGLCGVAAAQATTLRSRALWLLGAFAAAASAYFSTGRSNVVLPLLVAAIAYAAGGRIRLRPRIALAAGGAAVLVVLAVFTAGGAIIGKTLENNPLSRVDSVLVGTAALQPLALPYQYATAPIAALDVQRRVSDELPRMDGCATASVLCQLAAAAGLPAEPVERIRPFTAEPMPWNTYTALDLPLLDAGWMGVLVFCFAAGLVLGVVHRHAGEGRTMAVVAYGVLGSAVLYAPVQNNFLAPHVVGALVLAAVIVAVARVAAAAPRGGAGRAGRGRRTAGRLRGSRRRPPSRRPPPRPA